jgi:site-specific recombinase XerD
MTAVAYQALTTGLSDQIEEFLAEKKRRKAPATVEQYRFVIIDVWLPWCRQAGVREASEATDKVMERFTDYLQSGKDRKRPLSIATIRTYLMAVRVFLNWASVPRGRFEQPAKPRRMRDVLSRQEIDTMERVAVEERDRLIVRLLADTGMRVSGLLGLRPGDLRADAHARQYFLRITEKGDKEREVGVPATTFKRLEHFANHGIQREYIFYSKRPQKGRTDRLTKSGLEQLVRHLAKSAEIERRVWPHLFRHSYATHMARKKVPMLDVAKQLGHKSLAMVAEVYSHITAEDTYDSLMAALK